MLGRCRKAYKNTEVELEPSLTKDSSQGYRLTILKP